MNAGERNLQRQVSSTTVHRYRFVDMILITLAVLIVIAAGLIVPAYVAVRFWHTAPDLVRQITVMATGGWILTGLGVWLWRESG